MLREKNAIRDQNQLVFEFKVNDSPLWKGVAKVWPFLSKEEWWAIGNGQSVNLWSDKWIDDNTRLKNSFTLCLD